MQTQSADMTEEQPILTGFVREPEGGAAVAGESGREKVRHLPTIVVGCLACGAMLRILCFVLGENTGGDALARAAITAEWMQHFSPRLNFEPWLPFHFWLMA